jgi:hypothetical protein
MRTEIIPIARIAQSILHLRGEKVILDRDLAMLYGVETRVLNQAIKRNANRFPADFMFRLSAEETERVSRFVTSYVSQAQGREDKNSSQSVMSSRKHRGKRYRPCIDGGIPRIVDLFGSLERGPAYLLALSIYCLAVTGGLVLLIVPGIYLAIRYCLFAQIITDTSASALAALRKAAALAHGNWAPLGALFLIAFLLNIAGMSLLGIGLIISFPVSLLAIAGFYRSLQPATV